MRVVGLVMLSFLVCTLGLPAATTGAQQMSEDEKARRRAEYYKLAGPAPEHAMLESMVGVWNLEFRYWPRPGARPVTFKGKSENRMILGGRFLIMEGRAGTEQRTMETMTLMGFDRRHGKYTCVAFDNSATYYVAAAGPRNEKSGSIVMYGEDDDPILGHISSMTSS